jgi:hypothetical protein
MYLTNIDLPAGFVAPVRKVSPFETDYSSMGGLTAARAAPYLYYAVEAGTFLRSTTLYQVHEQTGAVMRRAFLEDTVGKVVAQDGRPYLVSARISMTETRQPLSVARLIEGRGDDTLVPVGAITLTPDIAALITEPGFAAAATSQGIVVFHQPLKEKPISNVILQRVDTGPPLRLARTVTLPAGYADSIWDTLEVGADLYLALPLWRESIYARETHVTRLDLQTLKVKSGWRRLSSPDITHSFQPLLARSGGRLLVVWRNWNSDASGLGPGHDIKLRCSPQSW